MNESPKRWVARVQQTPFNFTKPMRIVVEAETEEAARQTLNAAGFDPEFQWQIREIKLEEKPLGKIISKEFEDDGSNAMAMSIANLK